MPFCVTCVWIWLLPIKGMAEWAVQVKESLNIAYRVLMQWSGSAMENGKSIRIDVVQLELGLLLCYFASFENILFHVFSTSAKHSVNIIFATRWAHNLMKSAALHELYFGSLVSVKMHVCNGRHNMYDWHEASSFC